MKSAEECFLEIVEFVNRNKDTCLEKEDKGEKIITSSILYCDSKSFDRNYVVNGYISYATETNLHFYFSNKRSYLSVDKQRMSDLDVARFQYTLLLLTAKLFGKYNIDYFIYNILGKSVVI
jgi:hypothetical protein